MFFSNHLKRNSVSYPKRLLNIFIQYYFFKFRNNAIYFFADSLRILSAKRFLQLFSATGCRRGDNKLCLKHPFEFPDTVNQCPDLTADPAECDHRTGTSVADSKAGCAQHHRFSGPVKQQREGIALSFNFSYHQHFFRCQPSPLGYGANIPAI